MYKLSYTQGAGFWHTIYTYTQPRLLMGVRHYTCEPSLLTTAHLYIALNKDTGYYLDNLGHPVASHSKSAQFLCWGSVDLFIRRHDKQGSFTAHIE